MGYLVLCQFIALTCFLIACVRHSIDSNAALLWITVLNYTLAPVFLLLRSTSDHEAQGFILLLIPMGGLALFMALMAYSEERRR